MSKTTCIFDAYGTLLDVDAAARAAAGETAFAHIAESWPSLSANWRAKQLEYSWLRTIMGAYTNFWQVTTDALDWALAAQDLEGDAALRTRLLDLYRKLSAYPEAPALLDGLKAREVNTGILSNGSPEMLGDAVASAGLDRALDAAISVEDIGIYKPDARVYQMVLDHFGCRKDEVLFVSSNGWDVAGAGQFGFETVWVNRGGRPVDRLPAIPAHIFTDLSPIAEMFPDG